MFVFPRGWLCVAAAVALGGPGPVLGEAPLTIDPIVAQAEQTRIEAIARATPSAVSVFVPGGAGGGSGVLISPDGFALTNFHVTSPAGSHMRCGLSDGNVYDAVIVGIDPVGDLAMIRLLGRDDFPAATLGDSRTAEVGDWSMVIGNPFLLATNLQPTVTWGILSGVGRYQYPSGTLLEYGDCLQTDASINPGNSGGPIYDAQGQLLGIVGRASFEKRQRVNVGVGYAISINQAKNFLGYLHSGRIVDHATLGATVATEPDGGVRVSNILTNSDAFRRGLRYGAEILEIDGRVVQSANDVQNVLATFPNGWRIKLTYRLDGETRTTLVRLMSVHSPDELLEKMSSALPPPPPRPSPEEERQQENAKPPGDADGDDDRGDDDEGDGHRQETDTHGASDAPPAIVAEQLIQRHGYANYHFNRVLQQRFIGAVRDQFPASRGADDSASDGASPSPWAWVIDGQTDEPEPRPVRIRVTDGDMALLVGDRPIKTANKSELYDAVVARSTAGILPALDAWRRMIADGPQRFGETFYLGSMPLGGERPLRDCIVGIDGELEVRWLSHPQSKSIEVIEVFADRGEDPAELWISREGDDRTAPPSMLDLRYGLESVLRIRVDDWKVVPAASLAGDDDAGDDGAGDRDVEGGEPDDVDTDRQQPDVSAQPTPNGEESR